MNTTTFHTSSLPRLTSPKVVVSTEQELFAEMFKKLESSFHHMQHSPSHSVSHFVTLDHVIVQPAPEVNNEAAVTSGPSDSSIRSPTTPLRVSPTSKRRPRGCGIKVTKVGNGSIMASFRVQDINSDMFIGKPRKKRASKKVNVPITETHSASPITSVSPSSSPSSSPTYTISPSSSSPSSPSSPQKIQRTSISVLRDLVN